jgi:putative sigma-54 modulation protein
MKILFHGDHTFSRDAEEFIANRCESAFDRFQSAIREIRVNVRDENGPRGGDDIRCTIHILMAGLADVIVHELSVTLQSAVGEAIDRAAYQVSRRLGRHKHDVRRLAVAS